MGQLETLSSQQLDHIYYTLFCMCTTLLHLLPTTATRTIMLSQNHFPEPNLHMLDFLHPIFQIYRAGSHTPSTAGDALRTAPRMLHV
jgi:hypothetical protein